MFPGQHMGTATRFHLRGVDPPCFPHGVYDLPADMFPSSSPTSARPAQLFLWSGTGPRRARYGQSSPTQKYRISLFFNIDLCHSCSGIPAMAFFAEQIVDTITARPRRNSPLAPPKGSHPASGPGRSR